MAKRHTAAAAACLLLAGCLVWAGRKRTVTYLPDESAFPNAQIGYAPVCWTTAPRVPPCAIWA